MKHVQEPAGAGGVLEGAALAGRLLRERRRSRGLSIEEVELAIRFGVPHILAVEEGRFDRLPAPPYGRGLVSAYARLVGIPPEELLRVCGPALSPEGGERGARIFRSPLGERLTWREWTVPIALALAVAVIAVVRAALAPAPAELAAPARRPAAAARPAQPVAASADVTPAGPVAPAPSVVPGVRVLLRSEGTTWVEAAADGAETRRSELGPGQNLELTARERLTVSLGDSGVVRLRVGERELGFIGYKGETKTGLSFVAPRLPAAAAPRPAEGD